MDNYIFTKKNMYWHENQNNRERKYKYNVSMKNKVIKKWLYKYRFSFKKTLQIGSILIEIILFVI